MALKIYYSLVTQNITNNMFPSDMKAQGLGFIQNKYFEFNLYSNHYLQHRSSLTLRKVVV